MKILCWLFGCTYRYGMWGERVRGGWTRDKRCIRCGDLDHFQLSKTRPLDVE